MIALQISHDPGILEGDGPIYEEGRPVERETLAECAVEYAPAVRFFSDWERGLFHLGLDEYLTLPTVLVDLRRMYLKHLEDVRREKEKRGNANQSRN